MTKQREIIFEKYKAFSGKETLKLKPITLILGKNSSGKTSLCKLVKLMSQCVSGELDSFLSLSDGDVRFANSFENLFHRHGNTGLSLGINIDSVALCADYFINDGKLEIFNYTFKSPESTDKFKKGVNLGTIKLKGIIDEEYLKGKGFDVDYFRFTASYIGPVRKDSGEFVIKLETNTLNTVGYKGESAYQLLLRSWLGDKKLFNRVSDWMETHLEGQKLVFKALLEAPGMYGIYVEQNEVESPITEVGEGITQLLPIVVDAFNGGTDISIMEQPVLHLHPAAHADVAYLLGLHAKEQGRSYVIESHAENLLLGFRDLVSDSKINFNSDDIIVYFVNHDDNGAYLEEIKIEPDGELTSWPTGIFGESFDLIQKICQNNRMKQ